MSFQSVDSGAVHFRKSVSSRAIFLKRTVDVVACSIFIIAFAPLIAFLIILVSLDGGAAFYSQERIGRNGAIFSCWKFRTMVEDADRVLEQLLAEDAALRQEFQRFWKLKDDPRVTLVGKFLRRYSLDELPQIFNVLRGDMSLVGPRPRPVNEMQYFESVMPELNHAYLSVKPGLTGLWQISGRNHLTLEEKAELDARYARDWCVRGDFAIILATFPIVFSGDGAF
jgi:undecaprenyl-phosphate galactose phosphotransferase